MFSKQSVLSAMIAASLVACEPYAVQEPVAITVNPVFTDDYQCAKGVLVGGYNEYSREEFTYGSDAVHNLVGDVVSESVIQDYASVTWLVDSADWLAYENWNVTTLWWHDESCTGQNASTTMQTGEYFFSVGTEISAIDCAPTSDPLEMNCVTTTLSSDTGSL